MKKAIIILLSITLTYACKSNATTDSITQDSLDNRPERQQTINEIACRYKDSTYTATAHYHNSRTGYSSTYTLDAVVKNCKVVQIKFPNGGWLDEDHITPAKIGDNDIAQVQCEGGKTYRIDLNCRKQLKN